MRYRRICLPERCTQKTGTLVEIKIKKGENDKISWGCLSALIEAKIALEHAKILLKEECLIVNECAFEDANFNERNFKNDC